MSTESSFFDRPVAETLGRCPGYAFAGDGVQTATGNYTRTDVDLVTHDRLLTWARTYNSRTKRGGVLGRGWTFTYSMRLESAAEGAVRFHDRGGRVLSFVPGDDGDYRRPQDLDADLHREDDGSFTLCFFAGERWHFSEDGRLLSLAAEGRRVELRYDDEGRVVMVVHSAGLRFDLSYGAGGLLSKVTADDGREVAYAYSGSDLVAVTGSDGAVLHYDTDDDGLLTSVREADDIRLIINSYDDVRRVTEQQLAGAGGVQFMYHSENGRTDVTARPSGGRSFFQHDRMARVSGVTDALGNTVSIAYDQNGRFVEGMTAGGTRLEREYDADGNLRVEVWGGSATRYVYDDKRRVVRRTDPTGGVTNYEYIGASRLPVTVTDPSGARTRYTVKGGLVTSRRDPDQGTQRWEYNARRLLVAATDATGGRTEYAYDAAGRLVRVTTPSGETIRYKYDRAGRILQVMDAADATTQYRYSSAGRRLSVTDPVGAVETLGYDEAGRMTERVDRLGARTRFAYDDSGRLSSVTLPDGTETTATRDVLGRIIETNDPTGTIQYTYDSDGRCIKEEGLEGTTTTEWDARGNPLVITGPDGTAWHYTYDLGDRLITLTDPAGAVQSTRYEDEHRRIVVTNPAGARTTQIFTGGGHLHAVVDALGRRTEFQRDRAGRVVERVDPEGGRTRYTHDSDGRLIARISPADLLTRWAYQKGRLIAVTNPRGFITRYAYDARGDRTQIIEPGGAVTRRAFDNGGRLIRITDPRGGVTRLTYDAVGNLTSITDAKGAVARYTHDAAGRRTSRTDPLGRRTRREYDVAGRLTAVIEPSGRTVRMEYDEAGRLVRRYAEDGSEVRFTYDKAGRRLTMQDASGATRYTYDKAGRPVTVTGPDGADFHLAYDKAGQRIALRYPDGAKVTYRYNLNGHLVGMRDSAAGEAVYAVDPDGKLLTEQLPGGWLRKYAYDGGLLCHFSEIRAGVPVTCTRLARNADDRIIRREDSDESWTYAYDPAGQLVRAIQGSGTAPPKVTHFAYDLVGNRTSVVDGSTATRFLYDAADQLLALETEGRRVAYTYDPAGRLREAYDGDVRHRVEYDGLGSPREAVRTRAWAMERVRTTYDGDKLLACVSVSTGDQHAPETTVDYRWSPDSVPQILTQRVRTKVPQADDTAPLGRDLASARFTYGHGRAFATSAHGSVNFARDVFGTAVHTEQTAPWTWDTPYDPFGAPAGEQPTRPPLLRPEIPRFGYRGELMYGACADLRVRQYDTTLGRFTTRDPLSVLAAGSGANNPYAYAANDPLNKIDPQGTWAVADTVAGLLAGLRAPLVTCDGCPSGTNSIESHRKCFQGTVCLSTRGGFDSDELNAEQAKLVGLWKRGQGEAAGQAMAIHELNRRRQGLMDKFLQSLGADTEISYNVDWEVGIRGPVLGGYRIDIMTSERNHFECKRWAGPATWYVVEEQLQDYELIWRFDYGLTITPSTELQDWADGFQVYNHWYSIIPDTVYVWGLGNTAGHIYIAKDDKTRDDVKEKANEKIAQRKLMPDAPLIPGIRFPVPVPV
ncbi:DUF6531 domain-containing protein [Streptomyces beigongshangae]|uniref:DUF6531 domain-containing protein n=1 Tax=Streptomyces beigongshangae TaxID=2841597 RepID=UPI001C8572E3|nr:DUF6531 domain-containing protein [Streptomyces sp. REN17]